MAAGNCTAAGAVPGECELRRMTMTIGREILGRLAQGRSSVQKSYYPKPGEVESQWLLVDAQDENLGRLATRIATALLGKDKPQFTPGVDVGDFVVVYNAERIAVTGKKLDGKLYYRASGYPGGLKTATLPEHLA